MSYLSHLLPEPAPRQSSRACLRTEDLELVNTAALPGDRFLRVEFSKDLTSQAGHGPPKMQQLVYKL